MRIFCILLLLSLASCGDLDSDLDGLTGSDILARVNGNEPAVVTPDLGDTDVSDQLADIVQDDSAVPSVDDSDSGGAVVTNSFITGRIFMPGAGSGFKCQAAETRGGQTVCLLPHQYTLPPFYTKTDHHGSRFGCNVNGETFQRFILDAAGTEYPMFIERNNPFGPQSGVSDYFCANYVGTASGNVGRTHVRLTKLWSDFNGQSVSIKVCDDVLCDTLILR